MKVKSRKEARKELRKAKKMKKHEFFLKRKSKIIELKKNSFQSKKDNNGKQSKVKLGTNNKGINKFENQNVSSKISKRKQPLTFERKQFKSPYERVEHERQIEKIKRDKLQEDMEKTRRDKLITDNEQEDLEIKKLEKQLKMKKGKSKAFVLDGLDYLLDVCDKKLSENELESAFKESDSEFDSDLDNIIGEPKTFHNVKKKSDKNKSNDEFDENHENSDLEYSESDEESLTDISDDINDYDLKPEISDSNDLEKDNKMTNFIRTNKKENEIKRNIHQGKKVENAKGKKVRFEEECESKDVLEKKILRNEGEKSESFGVKKLKEDIYGRIRDETGNIVTTYVPPQLRKNVLSSHAQNSEKLERLKKQLKGLLNRLAESNMIFISNQIEQLYNSNSRNAMNETLYALYCDSLFTEILTPERLITEHAMLIAVLHANIGSEIGAYFLQFAVVEFNKMLTTNSVNLAVDNKKINNLLIFIMHLYNFQLFHSKLMYEIINELLQNLGEKEIELLLMTLRTIGFSLRKDDPTALKNLVLNVQKQINLISVEDHGSRVKFMLEMLMAIKNNNMTKIPNYDPELVENLRKRLKVFIRKGNYITELNISLQDLLNAEKHGRWWIVGSAWSGGAPCQPDSQKAQEVNTSTSTQFSQKLLDLARKQRMNTDVRKNIFCILMSSEDFLDAFEKLMKLKLKGTVEREIINIVLHCALQEKTYNPYYMHLANRFCLFDRKYQIMLQYALWDKIKEMKDLLSIQITNLAKFVGNIILERGLPISVLKVIEFSELNKPTIKFMRQVLLTILVSEDKSAVVAVFKRVSQSTKLKLFRDSLNLFLQHFVVKNTKKLEQEKLADRLTEMVKIVEQTLTSSDDGIPF